MAALSPTQLPSITATATTLQLVTATDQGFGNVTVQITGTWTGTIGFFAGIDGVVGNIQPLAMYASNTTPATFVTTTTGNGVWRTFDATGINIYIQSSGSWTGTAVVTVYANAIN